MSRLLPPEQLIAIARSCVKKYRPETSPEFEDFRQEVLLGILERERFFNPDLGTMRRFVMTVAQQVAKQCEDEFRIRQRQAAANPRTQLPTNANAMDADDADEFGLLVEEDAMLAFIQLTVFLPEEERNVLVMRLSRHPHRRIRKEFCIAKARYTEIFDALKVWAADMFFGR